MNGHWSARFDQHGHRLLEDPLRRNRADHQRRLSDPATSAARAGPWPARHQANHQTQVGRSFRQGGRPRHGYPSKARSRDRGERPPRPQAVVARDRNSRTRSATFVEERLPGRTRSSSSATRWGWNSRSLQHPSRPPTSPSTPAPASPTTFTANRELPVYEWTESSSDGYLRQSREPSCAPAPSDVSDEQAFYVRMPDDSMAPAEISKGDYCLVSPFARVRVDQRVWIRTRPGPETIKWVLRLTPDGFDLGRLGPRRDAPSGTGRQLPEARGRRRARRHRRGVPRAASRREPPRAARRLATGSIRGSVAIGTIQRYGQGTDGSVGPSCGQREEPTDRTQAPDGNGPRSQSRNPDRS